MWYNKGFGCFFLFCSCFEGKQNALTNDFRFPEPESLLRGTSGWDHWCFVRIMDHFPLFNKPNRVKKTVIFYYTTFCISRVA